MFRKTPKTFNAVDMILGAFVDQCMAVVEHMMLAQTFQRIVASERIGVVDRALPGFLPNDGHQLLFGHMLHHPRVYLPIALQKAKNNVLAGRSSSALPLTSAAKVTLVHFNLAVQFAALKLGHVIDCFAQMLVDARDSLIIEGQIMREAVRRLLLIETLDDGDFCPGSLQRFLFSADLVPAPRISSGGLPYLKRTTENTLFAPQKVGRAPENVLFPSNHKDILTPCGYETH